VFVNVSLNAAERPASLWEQCLSVFLRLNPEEARSLQWLKAIKHISAENGILCIEAPSEFAKGWLLGHFYDAFLKIAESIEPSIKQISIFAPKIKEESRVITQPPELKKPEKLRIGGFCKKYELSNFIAETSNELALKSAHFMASMPRPHENFLVIKGAPGLGKTHLLHAIGNEAYANWASRAVLWDSDRFFKEKRRGNLSMLHQADILLFDDLQNIYASEPAQKDLLDILKKLKSRGSSIIVAVNPKSKNQATGEFSDFLKMGIKCDLKKPDLRTRIAILRQKAIEKGLPAEALETCWKPIAEKLGESVSSLEGAINELAAKQALLKCEISPKMALAAYEDNNCIGKAQSIESIASAVAIAYQIPLETLCGKGRMASINRPRQIAIYLCRQAGFSISETGKFFNRDASSVSNAIKNIKSEIASEGGYSLEFELKSIMGAAMN
jgi:chromosomal replication initiator protein